MLIDMLPDQELFRATVAEFLATHVPLSEVRRLGDHPDGFEADYWRRGADLGWTALLADADGESSSGRPVLDAALVAYEFGRHCAPGPLTPVAVAVAALHETGSHPEVLAELVAGSAIASRCHPVRSGDTADIQIVRAGTDLIVHGVHRMAESARGARYFLVTGETNGRASQVLVPAATPGVAVTPLRSLDLVRRFGTVRFDAVRLPADALVGEIGAAEAQSGGQALLSLVLHCAETVGAMRSGFEMTVEWAAQRYSFGRPLNSYQALKHRFADLKTWLEAAHAITAAAAAALEERAPEASELASAAHAYLGHYGLELLQDCVQLHGGIGLTFEHDLHLFLRRATVNTGIGGAPADHRRRLAGERVPA